MVNCAYGLIPPPGQPRFDCLADSVLAQVQAVVGKDVVRAVSVRGPQAPSWRAGPRVVKGRGPRDTYG